MLDIDIEDDLIKNQNSYQGLISTIEISQGMLVLIIASCAPGAFQAELIDRYAAELAPSIPSYRIELDRSEPSLRQSLENLVNQHPALKQAQAAAAITVTGAANLRSFPLGDTEENSPLDRFFGYLQWTREGLREFPYPIVLWVTPQILTLLSSKAPDFWSWRGGVFRFIAPVVVNSNIPDRSVNYSFNTNHHSDLQIDELLEQVAQIEAINPNSPALATLFDRVGQAYVDSVNGNGVDNLLIGIKYFQLALTIQAKLNLNLSKVYTLLRSGKIYSRLGNYKQTELLVKEAFTIATKLDDRSAIASSLNELGYIARKRGNYDEATTLYQQSLQLYTELGDRISMATTLILLGDTARNRDNWAEAENLYQQSLALRRELDDRAGIATIWGLLGDIARKRGSYGEAEDLYQECLKIEIENGNRAGIATSWGCLGDNELERGNLESAEEWMKKALTSMEDLQMTWYIAETNWDLAKLYRAKGDEQQAQQHYSIAHQLFTQIEAKGDLEKIESKWL